MNMLNQPVLIWSSIAFGLVGWGLPVAFPNLDPFWGKLALFVAAAIFLIIAAQLVANAIVFIKGKLKRNIAPNVPQEIIETVTGRPEAKRDTEMHLALAYIETREWGLRFVDIVMKPGAPDKGFSPATVRQAAIDGEIRVWGKPSQNGPYVLIPAGYWEIWQIDWYSAWGKCHTEIAESGYTGGTKHYDLMVSKVEIEKKWPPKT